MKTISTTLLLLLSTACILNAQTVTNERVLKLSSNNFKLEHEQNYTKALAMAKEKKWEITIKLRNGSVAKLAGVDEFGFPKYIRSNNNLISAITSRASQLWPGGRSGLNLSGSSAAMRNKIGIWEFDGAPLSTHVEFGGRVQQKDIPTGSSGNDHATHVAGTMIGAGVNPIAKGMAFGAVNLIAYDYLADLSEMTTEAAAGMLLSNHSYGLVAGWSYNDNQNRWEFWGRPDDTEDYRYGFYSNDSRRIDSIAYNAPNYLIVSSSGNDRNNVGPEVGKPYFRLNSNGNMVAAGNRPSGISNNDSYDIISSFGVAKNNITVGAVNGIPSGYNKPGDVVMSAFSGWGPTDDGRIKPDLVANGVSVTSASTNGVSSYTSKSGTSMSAPSVTGSLLLLQEYFSQLKPNTFMRSSTLKGLAIHTTDEAGSDPGPDYSFGWGLLNVQKAASVLTNAINGNNSASSSDLLFENSLAQGGVFTRDVVASGKAPLSATIAWTDPVGTVNSTAATNLNDRTKKLVHDLDIQITRNNQVFRPWTLDPAAPSVPAQRGDNITDNVERVDVDSTIPGETYTITVRHKGNLERGVQAYALLVSGVGGTAYCASSSGGGGAKIDSLIFSNIKMQQTAGCKTYTNNTNITADVQAREIIPITVRVATCDATTNNRMVKVFIDYNNDGDFNDANESVATSAILPSSTTNFNGNITIPDNVVVGTLTRMRIVVQETSVAADITPCGNYGKGETQDYLIRIANPSNDVSLNNIISPQSGACSNPAQYITVAISNNGSLPQTNVPISISIANGATNVATINETYRGTIAPQSTINHTFQTPFTAAAGITYTLTATTALASDQNATNNQLSVATPISANADLPVAEGIVCESSAILRVINPGNSNYFWYNNNTIATPFAIGTNVSANSVPNDRTYFVAKEARGSIGAVSKLTFPNGGYNNFAGNFMKFSHDLPITIETVRMYIGNSGRVRLTVGDNLTPGSTAGTYTYRPIAATTLNVLATTPTPAEGAVTGNNPADSGAVYAVNLAVSGSGEKVIIAECLDGATIFRNNGITGTIYPFGVNGLMNYTGNSVGLAPQPGQSENQFWYFLYDTRVSTGCVSNRVPVVAAANIPLTVSQVADSLMSSIATGTFQWIFNDTGSVSGGNIKSIKPARSGNYKVIVTDGFGCARTSANFNYTVTAINTVDPQEIKLSASPNPNNGIFQLSFEVSKRSDLSIELVNLLGQRVYLQTAPNFIGKFNQKINIQNLSSAFYLLKIQHDKKTYIQKIVIQ